MKICICTTPIRPEPTYFPPFGSLAIIQSLRKLGEAPQFFHIDYHRYTVAEIEDHFARHQFDLVGISSVVSTAYAYTKFLAALIKRVSPRTVVVVGGNLAASAEILLRKCDVDYCVVGDGEITIQHFVTTLREYGANIEKLGNVKGICFLDNEGKFIFTGYGSRLSADEIDDPDYSILENDGSIETYIPLVTDDGFLPADRPDVVAHPGRAAIVITSKGCIARCTFCHRWEKGYRPVNESKVQRHLEHLIEKYQVQYVSVGDENFGSDKGQAHALATSLGKLGIIWRAGGVRASTVTLEALKHWKANGCVLVNYGIESGSPTILRVMEKKISVEQNINALKWTYETGLRTVLQLVMGMPGETDRTVAETIEFLKKASDYLYLGEEYPSGMISLNYAQALPGTPLYEYAREHGFLGRGMDDEERYLLDISDTDAYSEDHFINYTGLPLLKVLMWRQWVLSEVDSHFIKTKFHIQYSLYRVIHFYIELIGARLRRYLNRWIPWLARTPGQATIRTNDHVASRKSGYYNINDAGKFTPLLLNPITRSLFFPILALGVAFARDRRQSPFKIIAEYLLWLAKKTIGRSGGELLPEVSLRKVVTIVSSAENRTDDMMIPLRTGR